MDEREAALAFLESIAPRMRQLGVASFTYGDRAVTLGEDPAAKVAPPAPVPRHRLSAVDLAISGPPVTPQYADAKPAGK